MADGVVSEFIDTHFRHFNAAALVDAAKAYRKLLDDGGRMFLAMAGAMSTAELGVSLARMIREGKIHAICCTGANLEEDLFHLVARRRYERIPNYRDLTPADEEGLLVRKLNRVTDTCIPEEEAMRCIERRVIELWLRDDAAEKRRFPHQVLYELLRDGGLQDIYDADPAHSWMLAAAEADLPLFVPGWEDSTLGNIYAAYCIRGELKHRNAVRGGVEYMISLADWYMEVAPESPVGFFQIGGGIAGDFPICVVLMLEQDLCRENVPRWAYFCQISDSTTSYGSYSGAVPNEKITWGKLTASTPKFIVESDATIVAPLIFAYVLGL